MSQITVSDINNATNNRIYDRCLPSSTLRPYYQPRPQQTKYTHFQTHSDPVSNQVPLLVPPPYETSKVFYPGDKNAPWSGFAKNVDLESDMRNQNYALQKCTQAFYVPESSSDLYTLQGFTLPDKKNVQKHPLLFEKTEHSLFNPNITNTSKETFNNHTRQDIKGADTRM